MAALCSMGDVPAASHPREVLPMKKIQIRKAGPVRLTSSACHVYPNPS